MLLHVANCRVVNLAANPPANQKQARREGFVLISPRTGARHDGDDDSRPRSPCSTSAHDAVGRPTVLVPADARASERGRIRLSMGACARTVAGGTSD